MGIKDLIGKDGVKNKDIKDVERRTSELIRALIAIRNDLVGKGPADGLVHLSEIISRDPGNAEFRTILGKLVAKLYGTVDKLQKESEKILVELKEVAQAGHDILLIRNEDVLVENLTQGFAIVNDQLVEMRTGLRNLPQSADRDQLAADVMTRYMELIGALRQLSPMERELEKLYEEIERLV
ncbi:hypothetical protein J4439_03475 [Candidatus Woesearchaeota archaeon]|nr:hypothetical protein [Candidatus Woesearchaeota archaeon]